MTNVNAIVNKEIHSKPPMVAGIADAVGRVPPAASTTESSAAANAEISSKICSLKLIHLVRRNEVLYNSDADGYTDKNHKEAIWEQISRHLFPLYDTFSDNLKERIRLNVRRRWKTLRNSIAREVKKTATIENYCRKKESSIIAELEFLIPHIKSAHCAKLTDELGLRENYTFMQDTEERVSEEDDYNDLIDLTDSDIDVKPLIKLQPLSDNSYSDNSCDSLPPNEALYPSIKINTDDVIDKQQADSISTPNWSGNEFCTVAQYRGGEFTNTVICSTQDNEEIVNTNSVASEPDAREITSSVDCSKRRRIDLDESSELHSKLLDLLNNQENKDEDRMFLLSLVSDLRRVPAARKMLVKAEIVTAIARGLQS